MHKKRPADGPADTEMQKRLSLSCWVVKLLILGHFIFSLSRPKLKGFISENSRVALDSKPAAPVLQAAWSSAQETLGGCGRTGPAPAHGTLHKGYGTGSSS